MDIHSLHTKLSHEGISLTHLLILQKLCAGEVLNPSKAAVLCSFTTAASTGMLDRMEKAGLITRTHAATGDRRQINLAVTEQGRRCLGRVEEVLA